MAAKKAAVPETCIVILQRGWVFVGQLVRDGSRCVLEKAMNVRRWGTKKGLGELATTGPLPDTVLDPTGRVEFHELTAIATIRCEEAKWATILK